MVQLIIIMRLCNNINCFLLLSSFMSSSCLTSSFFSSRTLLSSSSYHFLCFLCINCYFVQVIYTILICKSSPWTSYFLFLSFIFCYCRLHLLKARCKVFESSIIAGFEQQSKVTLIWTNRISPVFWVSNDNSSLCCTI